KSLGIPHEWSWEFEGAVPSTSSQRNPTGITYPNEGTYEVTLTVSNPAGEDTQTITDYITVSGSLLPEPAFSVTQTSFCTGEEAVAEFTDESTNCPAEWEWIFEPNTVEYLEGTNSSSPNPVVQFQATGNYSVTLVVTNSSGSNSVTYNDYINVGGALLPFADGFEQGPGFNDWAIINPDNNKTWEAFDVNGDTAMRVNHYDYTVPPGGRDQLVSPVLDFSEFESAYLHFDHAYARQYTSMTDSLIVYISKDCGETWNRIFEGGEDGSGNFATHPQTDESFVPENPEDWCGEGYGAPCNDIDLSAYAGQNNIKIKFESYNYYNNNIYIDNVLVNNSIMTGRENAEPAQDYSIAVYPNPTKGNVTLVGSGLKDDVRVIISSTEGQVIHSRAIEEHNGRLKAGFNLSDLSSGIYYIKIFGPDLQTTKKVIVR
ncbi:MAG: PKD domain-containing protein, partial [Bacteroidales bacterium]|nr:PKD domain-containing protein [Bacteroidales bacterium]